MDEPTMRSAEEDLGDAFEETVDAHRRMSASFDSIRAAILAAGGDANARLDVERARATEAEQATEEPPPLP
jgi:hypothetical protein